MRLQFFDSGLQLRNGSADIGQLDDVGIGLLYQFAEFDKSVSLSLTGVKLLREVCDNTACKRDIASFNCNASCLGEGFDDWQE